MANKNVDEQLLLDDDIQLIDEDGNVVNCNILLTYHSDEFNKDYVVLYNKEILENDDDEESDLYPFSYTFDDEEQGSLEPVTDEAELAMINDVIEQFLQEQDEEE